MALVLLHRLCLTQTDGFTRVRIESDLPYDAQWECPEEIGKILDQPFYYLGSGAQTFAFASADDRFVLKFYRHHRTRHPLAFLAPLIPRLQQTVAKRENKRLKDFSSYRLAFERMRAETGLICIHLNKTKGLNRKVKVFDKIGIEHSIDLDKMEFLLQRKATPFYSTLEHWIEAGELDKAERGLSELVSLLRSRCQMGIFDKDPDLKTNFGFLDGHPIQFDVGRFKMGSDEMLRVTDGLRQWLEAKEPRLSAFLEEELK